MASKKTSKKLRKGKKMGAVKNLDFAFTKHMDAASPN
jgi:hypothetical protein